MSTESIRTIGTLLLTMHGPEIIQKYYVPTSPSLFVVLTFLYNIWTQQNNSLYYIPAAGNAPLLLFFFNLFGRLSNCLFVLKLILAVREKVIFPNKLGIFLYTVPGY